MSGALERVSEHVFVDAASGEAFDVAVPEQRAALSRRLAEWYQVYRAAKQAVDAAWLADLEAAGETRLDLGRYTVSEEAGRASYDADKLQRLLREAGMPAERVGELVRWEAVVDGRALGVLERRGGKWADIIAQCRSRGRGRVVVKERAIPDHL